MTTILDNLSDVQSEAQTAAEATYRELLARASVPSPGDAQKLAEVLRQLGRTADDVRADLVLIDRYAQRAAQAADIAERNAAYREARRRADAARDALKAAEATLREADAAKARADALAQRAARAAEDVAKMRAERPDLFA